MPPPPQPGEAPVCTEVANPETQPGRAPGLRSQPAQLSGGNVTDLHGERLRLEPLDCLQSCRRQSRPLVWMRASHADGIRSLGWHQLVTSLVRASDRRLATGKQNHKEKPEWNFFPDRGCVQYASAPGGLLASCNSHQFPPQILPENRSASRFLDTGRRQGRRAARPCSGGTWAA